MVQCMGMVHLLGGSQNMFFSISLCFFANSTSASANSPTLVASETAAETPLNCSNNYGRIQSHQHVSYQDRTSPSTHQPVAGNMYELLGHIANLLITFVHSCGFQTRTRSQPLLQKRYSISTNDNPSPGAEQYRNEPHQQG